MTISQPFKRIARPFNLPSGSYVGGAIEKSYLVQHDYAPNRTTAIRGYHAIESDLRRLFEYVEPDDKNLASFSTRLYEILLRAATEFESNCKAILIANGYSPSGKWSMNDYKKLETPTRISEYRLRLSTWANAPREIQPLQPWAQGNSLDWYQSYNNVKHNRADAFELANLRNAVDAVAALFAILFTQFNILAFSANELVSSIDNWDGWLAHHNSLFWIKGPVSWDVSECYEFTETTEYGLYFN